ncbi:MAG: cytochrome c biogenesis protein CcsA [Sulfurimonas sp.]|nr:cytochrome c biogenesis protein CcsA [Sulfurimonas sp.]
MSLISRVWSFLISMKLMVILILAFAVASAVGTFVENDYGVNTSWALIYSSRWFEAIQVLLGISLVGNIIRYKLYTLKKIPTFIFHTGFLVILIGSGVTRYYGYEGVMHIREGETENRMLSSDAFLQINAKKASQEFYREDIVYVSELGGRDFSNTLEVDGKNLVVTYKKFIDKAAKTAVEDPNGVPIVVFVIPTPQGPEKYVLKSGEVLDVGPLAVYFDKEPTTNNKPILRLVSDENGIFFVSNVSINWLQMIDNTKGVYERGEMYKFDERRMYDINGIQLVTKEVINKGKAEVISEEEYKKSMKMEMKMQSISALVVDVAYDGEHREVALMGNGKRYKGYAETLKIGDTEISLEWGAKIIELPFSLRLRDFILLKYPGSMSPSSYESHVTLIDKANLIQREHKVYMNHTLDYGGYLFFQSSYDKDEQGTILSVNHDPGKWPTYLGYILLGLGLFLNLFNPNGRFGKLARSKYEYKAGVFAAMAIVATLFTSEPLLASPIAENQKIDLNHANHYATMLVQGPDGRIKPLDTHAIDLLNKITGSDSMFGLNHNQIILGMATNPDLWKNIDMIKTTHPKVKKLLGMDESQKMFSFSKAFDKHGAYIFAPLAEEALRKRAALRDQYDKEIIKVDERVNVAYMVYSGRFMSVFPLQGDENNKWYYPEEALKSFPPELSHEVLALLKGNSIGLSKGLQSDDWDGANKAIDAIKEFQYKYGKAIIPDSTIIKAEMIYNNLKIFDRLFPIYLIAGFILLSLIFIRLAKPTLNIVTIMKIIFAVLVLAFIAHTISLGLRWYIAGHAPWSNGYEAMLYISWTIVFAGILFAKSSELAIATTAIFAGVTLFVAHLSWLDPQITSMVPVLKSYWLTIHVSIITASYGFLGLSTLLGFVSLIFYIMLSNESKREQLSVNILESTRISEMSMIVGLSLLSIGNFLGGVWANESWGRYWGWDPKETWALVSILVYVFVTHMRFVPVLKSNFIFNAVSVVAYSSIIMTYFGVNYYLSGLHSYAAGDPVPVPVWIYYAISVIAVIIIWASFNRDKLLNVKPIKK